MHYWLVVADSLLSERALSITNQEAYNEFSFHRTFYYF